MIYPAYQLNPGDMFQVEPVKVMAAMAAQTKDPTAKLDKAKEINKTKYENFEARYAALTNRMNKRQRKINFAGQGKISLDTTEVAEIEDPAEAVAIEEDVDEEAVSEEITAEETTGEEAVAENTTEKSTDKISIRRTKSLKRLGTQLDHVHTEDREHDMDKVKLETVLQDAKFVLHNRAKMHSSAAREQAKKKDTGRLPKTKRRNWEELQESTAEKQKILYRTALFRDRAENYLGESSLNMTPKQIVDKLVEKMRPLQLLRGPRDGGLTSDPSIARKALEADGLGFKEVDRVMLYERGAAKKLHIGQMKELVIALETEEIGRAHV